MNGQVIFGRSGAHTIHGIDGSRKIYNSDGSRIFHNSDGSKEIYNADGSRKIYRADGSRHFFGADGSTKIWGADGSKQMYNADGSQEIYGADGSKKIFRADGSSKICGADGSKEIYHADGSKEIYGADGSIKIFGRDGTLLQQEGNYGGSNANIIISNGCIINQNVTSFPFSNSNSRTTTVFNHPGGSTNSSISFNNGNIVISSGLGSSIGGSLIINGVRYNNNNNSGPSSLFNSTGSSRIIPTPPSNNINFVKQETLKVPPKEEREDASEIEGGAGGSECTICCVSKVNSVFIPCGHQCVCYPCAMEYQKTKADRAACLICRAENTGIFRTFLA